MACYYCNYCRYLHFIHWWINSRRNKIIRSKSNNVNDMDKDKWARMQFNWIFLSDVFNEFFHSIFFFFFFVLCKKPSIDCIKRDLVRIKPQCNTNFCVDIASYENLIIIVLSMEKNKDEHRLRILIHIILQTLSRAKTIEFNRLYFGMLKTRS